MVEEGRGQRTRCPECGAASDPAAVTSPLCGTRLPTADLASSVAQVEGTAAAQVQRPSGGRAPDWRRVAVPTIAFAVVLTLTGLLLIPARVLVGSFTFLAGVALLAIGSLLRYARPRGQ